MRDGDLGISGHNLGGEGVRSVHTQIDETYWRSICPISSALDVLGDKWSLLIVRDLIVHGTRTYSEFRESPEHISTNILASRLKLLSCLGLIERTNPNSAARNNAYALTSSGAALRPVLEGLGKWSQSHLKPFHPAVAEVF